MTTLARTTPPTSTVRVNEARALGAVRSEAAFVRSLLDEVERLVPSGESNAISAQLIEELGRLGCRCLEVAQALAAAERAAAPEASGPERDMPRCA